MSMNSNPECARVLSGRVLHSTMLMKCMYRWSYSLYVMHKRTVHKILRHKIFVLPKHRVEANKFAVQSWKSLDLRENIEFHLPSNRRMPPVQYLQLVHLRFELIATTLQNNELRIQSPQSRYKRTQNCLRREPQLKSESLKTIPDLFYNLLHRMAR